MGLIKQLREISLSQTIYLQEVGLPPQEKQAAASTTQYSQEGFEKGESFEVTVVFGDWRLGDSVKKNGVYNEEDFNTIQNLKNALQQIVPLSKMPYTFNFLDHHATILSDLKTKRPQLVLNLCDEGYENNALKELHLPAYMEMMDIPYTGAGPTCLGLCYDKALVRAIAVSLKVPVPEEISVNRLMGDTVPQLTSYPRFIKPALGDNSIGITPGSVVYTQEAMEKYIEGLNVMLPDRPVLIQEYLTGTEYGVGIVGNPKTGFVHLPVLEVDYSQLDPSLPPILGYESKFIPESPYWTQINYKKAELDEEKKKALYRHAERLFERCMCRDYARFDFRADANGNIKLLEVNPNPGWCWDGKLNKMAGMKGWSYSELIGAIVTAARKRLSMV